MLCKLLLLNFVALVSCEQNPTIYLNIVKRGSILTCDNTTATVMEGGAVKMVVNHTSHVYEISCKPTGSVIDIRGDSNVNFINIYYILPYMGSVWICTIVTSPRYQYTHSLSQQTERFGTNYEYDCAVIDCRIQMHVRREVVPQVILVNSMLLPSKRTALDESYDALAEYTFNDGDLVDVTCALPVNTSTACYLHMSYDYIDQLNNTTYDEILKNLRKKTNVKLHQEPVGFQLRMRAANDKTHAICTCEIWGTGRQLDDISTVRVNFLMRKDPIVNSLNIYINNAALRPTTDKNREFEYKFLPNYEYLSVTCESEPYNGKLPSFTWILRPFENDIVSEVSIANKKSFKLLLRQYLSFQCETLRDTKTVTLKPRGLIESTNDCSMRVWLRHSDNVIVNPTLEIYQYGNRWLIYEYKDDDTFILTCATYCEYTKHDIMYLVDSDGRYRSPYQGPSNNNGMITIVKNISGSEIGKDNVFECRLKYKYTEELKNRSLVFVHASTTTATRKGTTTTTTTTIAPTTTKAATTTTITNAPTTTEAATTTPADTDQSEESGNSLGIAVGGVTTCTVIICVIFVIYKMKNLKYNRNNPQTQPGEMNYENLPNDSMIPPFPPQWDSHFAKTVDALEAPMYSVPHNDPSDNNTDLYTQPIPKHKRYPAIIETTDPTIDVKSKGVQNTIKDLNYVEIMHNEVHNLDPGNAKLLLKRQANKFTKNDDSPHYAEIVAQDRSGFEATNSSKYANVQDLLYVNANVGSEYAEPTYCEPTYLKTNH